MYFYFPTQTSGFSSAAPWWVCERVCGRILVSRPCSSGWPTAVSGTPAPPRTASGAHSYAAPEVPSPYPAAGGREREREIVSYRLYDTSRNCIMHTAHFFFLISNYNIPVSTVDRQHQLFTNVLIRRYHTPYSAQNTGAQRHPAATTRTHNHFITLHTYTHSQPHHTH